MRTGAPDALQYYWRRLPLTLQPFDPVWFDKRDALGFERGEAGDPRARSVLQRIVARDANPEQARPSANACSTHSRDGVRHPALRQYRFDQ